MCVLVCLPPYVPVEAKDAYLVSFLSLSTLVFEAESVNLKIVVLGILDGH